MINNSDFKSLFTWEVSSWDGFHFKILNSSWYLVIFLFLLHDFIPVLSTGMKCHLYSSSWDETWSSQGETSMSEQCLWRYGWDQFNLGGTTFFPGSRDETPRHVKWIRFHPQMKLNPWRNSSQLSCKWALRDLSHYMRLLWFFFELLHNCLNCDSTATVTYSFHLYSRSSHHFILCLVTFTCWWWTQ